MYSHEEDIDSAIDVFKQAIEYYQAEQPGSAAHLALVREAANFKLKHGRKKEAISDLEQLWKQNTNDVHTLAQLISAYSLVDTDKAKSLSKHLPSADTMSFNVDVDELENSHGATYVRKKAATPDLERWLPMKERSYYRGKKKGKKKEAIGKGTQGATAAASAEFDASKTATSPPTSPRPGSATGSSTVPSGVVPPRQQKPSSGATRKKAPQKKKKGGKGGW
uniref:Signal recognition particle subunit SRP72 n=1 Tax=Xiphophorus couchianus TaxID=32473 RepID=A0A3B5MAQ7_9TELE